jgi:hypothetical protein
VSAPKPGAHAGVFNRVQRVLDPNASTTLDLYTRRTDDSSRILRALAEDDDADGRPARGRPRDALLLPLPLKALASVSVPSL